MDHVSALTHLKKIDKELHKAALPHIDSISMRVTPKKTNAALFQALASSIVSQQLSTKAAASIFKRVQETLGGRVTPEGILTTSPTRLRSAGLSEAKIRSLLALSGEISIGKLHLLHLKRLPPEEAIARLVQIPGIGPWTAEMFLIFALGASDIFSPGDLILARRMQKHLNLPATISKKEMAKLAEQWSPHRSFVSLLFWAQHHADLEAAKNTPIDN